MGWKAVWLESFQQQVIRRAVTCPGWVPVLGGNGGVRTIASGCVTPPTRRTAKRRRKAVAGGWLMSLKLISSTKGALRRKLAASKR